MATKSAKPKKPPNQQPPSSSSSSPTPPQSSRSSSLSSHLAMVELKQRILTSISKLSDRDTHQIALEDLDQIIQTISPDAVSMLLNCLYDATNDPKPSVKKESVRLLAALCAAHPDPAATHLTKIIAHIVKRLKDSDSGVRDACRDAVGQLSGLYLKGDGDNVVGLFVKPLFEAMNEQNKGVQAGAAMCMAKMLDLASEPPVSAFQKLCSRICKLLNSQHFLAKAALLPVVSSLSQVGAIAPQGIETLLQSIHECLGSTDWATRKAAADALIALALNSSNLIHEGASTTITALEACRFDKIKPVRDSITEALQLWKEIGSKGGDGASSDDHRTSCPDGENAEATESSDKDLSKAGERVNETDGKGSSSNVSPSNSISKTKGINMSDKTVGILKKKAPALSDKELNPEFFQKLETRGSGDLPVEVVVPRRFLNSSNSRNEESQLNDMDASTESRDSFQGDDVSANMKYRNLDRGAVGPSSRRRDYDDKNDLGQRELSGNRLGFPKTDSQSEGLTSNRGNWLAIQKQLQQLERQQAHLMNMLQDFMGGSHDGMVTLENRVRGLERVVEDMARDLSISALGRRGNYMGFEDSSNRPSSKYNGFSDYPSSRIGRNDDGVSYLASSMRGRGGSWRSDMSEAWDFHTYGRNAQVGTRRNLGSSAMDGRSPKSDNGSDQANRRGWDKGVGPFRFGEGPSARSVWQASKDEATLEAIRVAGEDNGTARNTRVAIPEMTAEAMGDDNAVQERDPVWTAWSNAMDALHVGDLDSAFAEVLSTGDDVLLVKLMDRSGPVIDQLSCEVASEVLHAVAQFVVEPNYFDSCLSWIQQVVEITIENGADVLGIPVEVKRELLLNLHEASTTIDLPEDWEGIAPDQLLLNLASAWEMDLHQLDK